MVDKKQRNAFTLDEDQALALHDLESITKRTMGEMIREGIDLYIKVKQGHAAAPPAPDTMLSPIIFEPPYRSRQDR